MCATKTDAGEVSFAGVGWLLDFATRRADGIDALVRLERSGYNPVNVDITLRVMAMIHEEVHIMPRCNLLWLTGMGCLSLFLWAVAQGSIVPPRGPLQFVKGFPGKDDDYEGFGLMVDVWRTVRQNYVDEVDATRSREFWENAIGAGVHGLDSHSGFISAKEYEEFNKQSEAEFGGVGVQIHPSADGKKLKVISPIVGSPAFRAGIKPGDEIIKVGGKDVEDLKADAAAKHIQGKPGTNVDLTVVRPWTGKTFDVTLTRELIEIESVLGDQRDAHQKWDWFLSKQDGIGYIRLTGFTQKSAKEMKLALEELKKQGVNGLILDLRRNPGGLLRSAVDIANMFIPEGLLVTVDGRTHPKEEYKADPKNVILPSTPLVVLIDENSASASEILAAALQHYERATILGKRSYGKGSVQNVFPLENGKTALKLTTAKYTPPSGKNINRTSRSRDPKEEWGVVPDVKFEPTDIERDDFYLWRYDRDIVRDPIRLDEQLKLSGEALMAIGAARSLGMAGCDASLATADLLFAYGSMNRLPRSLHDPMRQGGGPVVEGSMTSVKYGHAVPGHRNLLRRDGRRRLHRRAVHPVERHRLADRPARPLRRRRAGGRRPRPSAAPAAGHRRGAPASRRAARRTSAAIAVHNTPGLVGALLVGVSAAKMLALALGRAADRRQSHRKPTSTPAGSRPGATSSRASAWSSAAGTRACSTAGRRWTSRCSAAPSTTRPARRSTRWPAMLGLGFPGGPAVERTARGGNPKAFRFPRSFLHEDRLGLQLQRPEDGGALRHARRPGLPRNLTGEKAKDAPLDPRFAPILPPPFSRRWLMCWFANPAKRWNRPGCIACASAAESRPTNRFGAAWKKWSHRPGASWSSRPWSIAPTTPRWPRWPSSSGRPAASPRSTLTPSPLIKGLGAAALRLVRSMAVQAHTVELPEGGHRRRPVFGLGRPVQVGRGPGEFAR